MYWLSLVNAPGLGKVGSVEISELDWLPVEGRNVRYSQQMGRAN
jgi:hypothetical protein